MVPTLSHVNKYDRPYFPSNDILLTFKQPSIEIEKYFLIVSNYRVQFIGQLFNVDSILFYRTCTTYETFFSYEGICCSRTVFVDLDEGKSVPVSNANRDFWPPAPFLPRKISFPDCARCICNLWVRLESHFTLHVYALVASRTTDVPTCDTLDTSHCGDILSLLFCFSARFNLKFSYFLFPIHDYPRIRVYLRLEQFKSRLTKYYRRSNDTFSNRGANKVLIKKASRITFVEWRSVTLLLNLLFSRISTWTCRALRNSFRTEDRRLKAWNPLKQKSLQ